MAFFDFFSRILNVSDNTSQTGLMNSAYGAVIFMIFVVTTFILFTFAIELLVGTDIEKSGKNIISQYHWCVVSRLWGMLSKREMWYFCVNTYDVSNRVKRFRE